MPRLLFSILALPQPLNDGLDWVTALSFVKKHLLVKLLLSKQVPAVYFLLFSILFAYEVHTSCTFGINLIYIGISTWSCV